MGYFYRSPGCISSEQKTTLNFSYWAFAVQSLYLKALLFVLLLLFFIFSLKFPDKHKLKLKLNSYQKGSVQLNQWNFFFAHLSFEQQLYLTLEINNSRVQIVCFVEHVHRERFFSLGQQTYEQITF